MRIDEDIKLEFFDGTNWDDYTDGLITANILRGIQSDYEGVYQQCEAGVLTVVSRNPQLDPYVNDEIRLSKTMRVRSVKYGTIFTGRINNINVDYQSKGKPQIVTLSVIDMLGTMALHTMRDSFLDLCTYGDIDLFRLIDRLEVRNYPSEDSEIIGFEWDTLNIADGNGDACGVSTPITALTMATNLAQSDGYFFFPKATNNALVVEGSIGWNKAADQKIQFDSRGGATSYREIILDDGFAALKNQVSIRTKDGVVPLYYNTYSVEEWGGQQANINTYLSGTTQTTPTNSLSSKVLAEGVKPTREIKYITFDATLVDDGINVDLCDNVFIYHELDSFVIERKYGVIGIEHNITQDDWEIRYHLKNMYKFETAFPLPKPAVSPLVGDTNQDFTFSITNTDELDLEGASYLWRYIGGTEPASLVNTTMSTAASPVVNYDVNTVGPKVVRMRVTNSYGINLINEQDVVFNVYGIAPSDVSFTYDENPNGSGKYDFTAAIATDAVTYQWDFGDGTTGIGRNITHQYTISATVTVTLNVSNPYGTTTVTETITVSPPPGQYDEVGTWGLRYIKLALPNSFNSPPGYYWPGMYKFNAKTSYTNTSRAAQLQTQYASRYNELGDLEGQHNWYRALDGIDASMNEQGYVNNTFLAPSNTLGLRPSNSISGTANFALVLDLNGVYYDIKKLEMDFTGFAASGAPITLDVYATTYVDSWPTTNPDATNLYNSIEWTKIGTFNRATDLFTPIVTMPLNLP